MHERIHGQLHNIHSCLLVVFTDCSIFVELKVMKPLYSIRTRHMHDFFTFYFNTKNDPRYILNVWIFRASKVV